MRIAIVDDKPQDCEQIALHARTWMDARHLAGEVYPFTSREDFLAAWQPRAFALILLDCILDEDDHDAPTGIDLAQQIRRKGDSTPIVLITTSRDFAIDGYAVHAAGYLVKPTTQEGLASVLDGISLPATLVRIGPTDIDIPVSDVVWCRSRGHSVELHTRSGTREVRTSLRELQDTLTAHGHFLSPARGLLVNLAYVTGLEGADYVMANGTRVPISRDSVAAMRAAWTDYLFERARNGGGGYGAGV